MLIGQTMNKKIFRPVDVELTYINAKDCMCEDNLKRYVKTMAPKTVEVGLQNHSNARITVVLNVSWKSRYRKPCETFSIDPRTIVLEPRSSKLEIIFRNTYYDLMEVPDGITASIKVKGKQFRDIKPENNSKNITQCEYYMY
jgi:hypothetical protein